MNLQEWKNKNGKGRNYAHFDQKVSLYRVWNYISDPRAVAMHGFYPFIHYTLSFVKYSKEIGRKPKIREIAYSAHIDRYIFQYYGYKLNQFYNNRVKHDNIDDVAIAYRDNLHKSNLHFAKNAIDFIKNKGECYVLIGDFTNYFDSLDHKYLKEMLCDLLDVRQLPPDYYAVFKNITRYSTWDLEELLKLYGLENDRDGLRQFNQLDIALPLDEFKRLKNKFVTPHKDQFGIPQGSAISAVLSNVYMLKFDKKIYDFVLERQGLYMRYSDDFIVILPSKGLKEFGQDFSFIKSAINLIPQLKLEPEKTQIYRYNEETLQNCNADLICGSKNGKNIINYLGISFDGQKVSLRDKTVSKYYYRLYRKLKTIVNHNGVTKNGHRISNRNLYEKYSIKGAGLGKGNFITYVKRAEQIFEGEKAIGNVTRKHMQKIRKRLNEIN